MLEGMLVGLIVVIAAGYAAWSLTPAMVRKRLALRAANRLGGPATAQGLRRRLVSGLHRIARTPARGCNDCAANTLTPAERAQPKEPGKKAS